MIIDAETKDKTGSMNLAVYLSTKYIIMAHIITTKQPKIWEKLHYQMIWKMYIYRILLKHFILKFMHGVYISMLKSSGANSSHQNRKKLSTKVHKPDVFDIRSVLFYWKTLFLLKYLENDIRFRIDTWIFA